MNCFDARRAYEYTNALAFPRRTGSGGEAKAADYIVKRLKELGLEAREESFSFLPSILGFLLKATVLFLLFLLSAIFFLFPFNPFLTGLLALLALILIGCFVSGIPLVAFLRFCLFKNFPFLGRPSLAPTERRMGRQGSRNIIATLKSREGVYPPPKKEDQGPPCVVFLAHYDSKSQSLPLAFRIVLTGVLFSGSIVILGFYLVVAITGGFSPGGWLYVTYSVTNFAGFLLLLTWTGNHSPGAIDNASGVGILLHLAEVIYRERKRFKGLDITFAFTGAEEEGLAGAFRLCDSLKGLSRDNTYFINLDGLGPKGRIYCTHKIGLHPTFTKGQGRFVSLIRESAHKEGLKVYSPPLVIGAMADHFPFVFEGFNAVTFSVVSRKSLAVHTPRDTMEQIDPEGLEEVGRLLLRIIEDIKEGGRP